MHNYRFNRPTTGLIVLLSPIIVPLFALAAAVIGAFNESRKAFREIPAAARYSIGEPLRAAWNAAVEFLVFQVLSRLFVLLALLISPFAVVWAVAEYIYEGVDWRFVGDDIREVYGMILRGLRTGELGA